MKRKEKYFSQVSIWRIHLQQHNNKVQFLSHFELENNSKSYYSKQSRNFGIDFNFSTTSTLGF